jgi:prepilin-type processing-associated H-X9-DG protein
MFYWGTPKDIANVSDGASNTIAVSEACADVTPSNKVKSGVAVDAGIWVNTSTGRPAPDDCEFTLNPSVCMNRRSGNTLTGTVRTSAGQERCSRYLDGLILYTGFTTILPPNAPNCVAINQENYWGIFTSSSYHTSGVNCGYVDGSVHFITESIDTGGLPNGQIQGTRLTGESFYGVWGALGTPSGGESKAP